jgi:hypothetical protein
MQYQGSSVDVSKKRSQVVNKRKGKKLLDVKNQSFVF